MLKKFIFLIISISFSSNIFSTPALTKKPWTFLIYIAADNDLAPFVDADLKEMMAGTNNNINTLVYLNIKKDNSKVAKKLIIENNKIYQVGQETNLDSGASSTLINAIKWATKEAPCTYFALDLWNHGTGPLNPQKKRGICFDDTTGNYLNDKDLQLALAETLKITGKKIDILCFDACLMASLEGDVSWADYVDFVVGSQQTISGYGWGYDKVLKLINSIALDPQKYAVEMVNAYKQTYINSNDYTMSAVSTKNIALLAKNLDLIANQLISLLSSQLRTQIRSAISKSRKFSTEYFEKNYIDLNHFFTNLLQNISSIKSNSNQLNDNINTLKNLLTNGMQLIKMNVINNVAGSTLSKSAGISIYFPTKSIDFSYYKLDWTQKYPNWLAFLKKYL